LSFLPFFRVEGEERNEVGTRLDADDRVAFDSNIL
jgi:hypothetical protein